MSILIAFSILVVYVYIANSRYDHCNNRLNNEGLNPSYEETRIILLMIMAWPIFYNEIDIILDRCAKD
jgi:hypothetical protein